MSTERSDAAYAWYLEAGQKFDYFVAGVSLALVGYLGSQFSASPVGWNPSTIELSAILTLLGSAIAGFKRIENDVAVLMLMQRRLRAEEYTGSMMSVVGSGTSALNTESGHVYTPQQAFDRAQSERAKVEMFREKLDQLATEGGHWYRTRNFLLLLGLGLLVFGRVAAAYF